MSDENPYQSPREVRDINAFSRRARWRFVPMACCAVIAALTLFTGAAGAHDEYINIKHGSKTIMDVIAVAAPTLVLTASGAIATRQWYRMRYRSALFFTAIACSPLLLVIDSAVRYGSFF